MSLLLATKLHRPALPARQVRRPHLIQHLNEGLASGCQLTLVSAPAGFGKSTCVSEWVDGLDLRPVSWLSLDPSDDDPARFLAYFVAALQKVDPRIGREIEGFFQAGQSPPIEALITTLLNDIENIDLRFNLVLDDFQVIKEKNILKAMEMLLANQPRNMHLVLITREDPPLPLARLRAHNQMTEIRAGDLRFSREETNRFLNEMMGLYLSEADIALLDERTEGWVVGLQLAGLSMRDRVSPSDFISTLSGSHRFILGYFTEEVLRRQTEETRQFLLKSSIMGQLNGDLCDAVIGRAGSSTLLEQLYTANLFLIPLDDEGRWFRYHHLFADLLQVHLRQTYPADAILVLHLRAAAWFEQNGWVNEAVDHTLAAQDFDGAARLIEQNSAPMMLHGELVTLLRWMEVLPAEVAQLHPLILIAKAWTLTLAGAVRQVEPLLCLAEAQIEEGMATPMARELQGNAAAIRAFFAMVAGEYPRAQELAERAEALLPVSSVQARALLPYTLGATYRSQGQYEKAVEAFSRVARMGEVSDDFITWATGTTEIANIRRLQGRLQDTAETCRQALQRLKERGVLRFGSLAKVEVPLIEVLREQNRMDEAYQRVTDVIARMQGWAMPTDRIFAYLALIHVQGAQGNFAGAFEALQVARDLKATHPVLIALSGAVDLCEIRLNLDTGEVASAAHLMGVLTSQPGGGRIVSQREQEQIMLARVRLAQGQIEEAVNILSSLADDPSAGERKGALIEILTLQARALELAGDQNAAVNRLLKALALAEPEGFVRIFVEQGDVMQSLLSTVKRQLMPSFDPALVSLKAYIDRLLSAFHSSQTTDVSIRSEGKANDLIEPLTDRELEVLRLIADGLKYEEIAHRLFISLNTVRTYVKAIYSKLNVNSRAKAVLLAHQLQLI